MVVFSVSFLVISYVLTNLLGPVGFILANCVNMLARIIHRLVYFLFLGWRFMSNLSNGNAFLFFNFQFVVYR